MRIRLLIACIIALQLINSIKLSVADVNCGIHCANCHQQNCAQCFRRRFKYAGPRQWVCSPKLAPKSHHCKIYSLTNCLRCENGYTWTRGEEGPPYCETTISPVKGCLIHMKRWKKEEICSVCINGVPSPDYKSCIPFPKDNPNELDNCLYGTRNSKAQRLECRRCKQRFIKLPRTRSPQLKKRCIPEFKGKIGCSSVYIDPQNNYHCLSCDQLRGYHFDGKGRDCVKG